jgi:Protein of unknown function (DUF1501)
MKNYFCNEGGHARSTLTRRRLLQVGGLGLLGLNLPPFLGASGLASTKRARAKSVIFLHQYGGPGHIDTFDMKPDAPDNIRGEYRPIASNVPGVQVCERLPRIARIMDKVTLIRSMRHEMKNHNSAGYYSLTGYAPPTDDQRLRDSRELFPAYGSIVDRLAPASVAGVPTFVSYPHVIRDGSITPGQHASFLGQTYDPFFIGQDPNSPDFRLPELSLPDNLTPERLENRRELMRLIDQQTDLLEHSARAQGINAHYQRALTMVTAPNFRRAFDLGSESASVRDRYGRTTYGQGCLLARKLVEAGVRFVTVYFAPNIGGQALSGGWDTHGFNNHSMYPILNDYLFPLADQTLPTLLEDLDTRGLLDETLVVWAGEFGRAPRISATTPGRDHWPQCYTVLLAGGGVKRGFVYGASDSIGAYPSRDPCRPEDLAATIYHLLGIDPTTEIRDSLNRPLPISRGSVVTGVLA